MPNVDPKAREQIRTSARDAAYNGSDADLWRDWLALVDSLRVPRADALALLERDGLRWFARFCFAEGLRDEGIAAYERLFLPDTPDAEDDPITEPAVRAIVAKQRAEGGVAGRVAAVVFAGEAEHYLHAVRDARGNVGVVEAWPRFAAIDPDGYASLQVIVADAEAAIGAPDYALDRLRALARRYHSFADFHAALARHARAAGLIDEAERHERAAAKRAVPPAEGRSPDYDALEAAFVAAPGLTLLPGDGPHVYGNDGGGNAIATPACPGCGVPILLLATIDTADAVARGCSTLSPLVERLPRLPILHCDNCQFMFALPDYRVAEDGRRVEVFSHGTIGRNATFDSTKRPAAQAARLVEPERLPGPVPDDEPWAAVEFLQNQRTAGPQVGGAPQPINSPRPRFCPSCDAPMIFYAAWCEAEAFEPNVIVNPDGYCYWFACPACRILSTDLDNS